MTKNILSIVVVLIFAIIYSSTVYGEHHEGSQKRNHAAKMEVKGKIFTCVVSEDGKIYLLKSEKFHNPHVGHFVTLRGNMFTKGGNHYLKDIKVIANEGSHKKHEGNHMKHKDHKKHEGSHMKHKDHKKHEGSHRY